MHAVDPDARPGPVLAGPGVGAIAHQAGQVDAPHVPVSRGEFSEEDVYATLGDVISGAGPGRPDDAAITVFDSTGVAIEDVAVARTIYEQAVRKGGYPEMDLV